MGPLKGIDWSGRDLETRGQSPGFPVSKIEMKPEKGWGH